MKPEENNSASAESDEASEIEESAALGTEDVTDLIDDFATNDRIVRLLPKHAVMGIAKGVARRVGRPRKVERKPDQSDLEYHAQMVREKAEYIENDPVVRAIEGGADTASMLHRVKEEVAREAASLAFQRMENEKLGKDSAQVSTRRIDALKKIAEIELEIKRMGGDTINLRSDRMQRLFAYIVEAFKEASRAANLSPQQIDLLFNLLSTSLEGWEEKAAELVR